MRFMLFLFLRELGFRNLGNRHNINIYIDFPLILLRYKYIELYQSLNSLN